LDIRNLCYIFSGKPTIIALSRHNKSLASLLWAS
jgi:hypothetical protein